MTRTRHCSTPALASIQASYMINSGQPGHHLCSPHPNQPSLHNGKEYLWWVAKKMSISSTILQFGKTLFCLKTHKKIMKNTMINLNLPSIISLYLGFIFQKGRSPCWPPEFPLCTVSPLLLFPLPLSVTFFYICY